MLKEPDRLKLDRLTAAKREICDEARTRAERGRVLSSQLHAVIEDTRQLLHRSWAAISARPEGRGTMGGEVLGEALPDVGQGSRRQ